MKLNVTFIILCTEPSISDLKKTVDSINWTNSTSQIIAVSCEKEERFKQICPTYYGKDTITSLINEGFRNIKTDWGVLVFSGSRIKTNLERKVGQFVKSYKDIFFPVIGRKINFVDASSNGILIHKKLFEEVGDFMAIRKSSFSLNDFEIAKLIWADTALSKGCQFKAIVGLQII